MKLNLSERDALALYTLMEALSERDALRAQNAKLESALNAAREAIEFVLDECDWNRGDSDRPFGGGDERIGPALSAALAQIDKTISPSTTEKQNHQ